MLAATMYLVKRQFLDQDDPDGGPYNWWFSPVGASSRTDSSSSHGGPPDSVTDADRQTAYAVKWSVLLALFVIFFLWITLGYYHARRRIKAGLKPLAYHKWLVPRSQREPQPVQNARAYYTPGNFGMQEHAEPPPVYSNTDMPPSYQPPEGGSKVALELVEQQRAAQQETGSTSGAGLTVPARTI